MRRILICLIASVLSFGAQAQKAGVSTADPFVLGESILPGGGLWNNNHGYTDTNGKTYRFNAINTGVKNLVLILAGQSLMAAEAPTAYTVTNSTVVDNFNVYDGGMYVHTDPPLGSTWAYQGLGGSGSSCATTQTCGSIIGRIADLVVNRGSFARVITVPVAVGGAPIALWDTGGILSGRFCAAMARLAARGITPSVTNVTFAILWGQGEADHGTSSATYKAALGRIQAQAASCGFSGRFFVNEETWLSGAVDATVQSAQTTVVDNVSFWAGGNLDSLNATNRIGDNTHLNDTGIAAAASLMEAAMHASGAPF